MTKLTKHQKKFWDYLKGGSNMEQRVIEHRLKKFMDSVKTKKLICDADCRVQIYNYVTKEKQC